MDIERVGDGFGGRDGTGSDEILNLEDVDEGGELVKSLTVGKKTMVKMAMLKVVTSMKMVSPTMLLANTMGKITLGEDVDIGEHR